MDEREVLISGEHNTNIGGSSPYPRIRVDNGPTVPNVHGASASNPINLDDDMIEECTRSLPNSHCLSQLEEETIVALDEAWTKATKEYNSLCIDVFPDAVIASMAREQSPEEKSKDTF